MAVKSEPIKFSLHPVKVELGTVDILEEQNELSKKELNKILSLFGFVSIDDKKSRMVEQIKNIIAALVYYSQ